jgi:DNA-binding IclR family transcriptional regulator
VIKVVRNEMVLDALSGRMTGQQVAERLGEPTREVIPLLADLHREGAVARVVDNSSVARFAPLAAAPAHQLHSAPPPLAVAA